MKSIIFQDKKYFVGKEITGDIKKYPGFFFNKIKEDDPSWYFVRMDKNWLVEDEWTEYYLSIDPDIKKFVNFEDSVDSPSEFISSDPNIAEQYFEAVQLTDTLKKL